jgi:hypothetical protein
LPVTYGCRQMLLFRRVAVGEDLPDGALPDRVQ